MDLKNCEDCKVGRWYYEMFGEIICCDNCPYKKGGATNAEN